MTEKAHSWIATLQILEGGDSKTRPLKINVTDHKELGGPSGMLGPKVRASALNEVQPLKKPSLWTYRNLQKC